MSETPDFVLGDKDLGDAARRITGEELAPLSLDQVEAIVQSVPLSGDGTRRRDVYPKDRARIEDLLDHLGLLATPVSQERRQVLVAAAQRLIDSGEAAVFLKNQSFTPRHTESSPDVGLLSFGGGPVYFNSARINGASAFSSWMGRGYQGSERVSHKHKLVPGTSATALKAPSIERIYEYAATPTEFPPIKVTILLRKDQEPLVFADDDHRTAAAKLRGEPIPVEWIQFLKEQ